MSQPGGHQQAVEELGDLLFTCVNLTRHLNVDADETLRRANTKFENRFRRMESRVRHQGGNLEDMTLAEMDALWESGKCADGE
jgi:ATP diphosphatase